MKISFMHILILLIWLQGCAGPNSDPLVLTADRKQTETQVNDVTRTQTVSEIEPATVSNELSYQNVLSRVLEGKCLNCHSEKGGNRGHLNLEGYQNIFSNRERIRSQVAELKMPKKSGIPLTENQRQLLIDWIDAGANELSKQPVTNPTPPNTLEPVPIEPSSHSDPVSTETSTPPDLANLNYKGVMKLVVETKCLKCHGINAKNGVELTTYENLVFNQDDIKKDVTSNDMPRRDQLTPDQKKLILDWINAGLPL